MTQRFDEPRANGGIPFRGQCAGERSGGRRIADAAERERHIPSYLGLRVVEYGQKRNDGFDGLKGRECHRGAGADLGTPGLQTLHDAVHVALNAELHDRLQLSVREQAVARPRR